MNSNNMSHHIQLVEYVNMTAQLNIFIYLINIQYKLNHIQILSLKDTWYIIFKIFGEQNLRKDPNSINYSLMIEIIINNFINQEVSHTNIEILLENYVLYNINKYIRRLDESKNKYWPNNLLLRLALFISILQLNAIVVIYFYHLLMRD